MDYLEIVSRLIGNINPTGNTIKDEIRLENLKNMCDLVEALIIKIDKVAYENGNDNSQEYSVKEISNYAKNFLENTLNIN